LNAGHESICPAPTRRLASACDPRGIFQRVLTRRKTIPPSALRTASRRPFRRGLAGLRAARDGIGSMASQDAMPSKSAGAQERHLRGAATGKCSRQAYKGPLCFVSAPSLPAEWLSSSGRKMRALGGPSARVLRMASAGGEQDEVRRGPFSWKCLGEM